MGVNSLRAHPFRAQWNHNTRYYPTVAEAVEGREVVLDAGCGDGTLARHLASRGHTVIGVDREASVLPPDTAGTHFILADVTNLPFPDDSFDAVVSVMMLHHTRIDLALVEMRRVLKPGGLLVDVGSARDKGIGDLARSALDVPGDLLAKRVTTPWDPGTPTVDPVLGWTQTRDTMARMLPGLQWRRVPGWRYVATWQRPV
ncbi:class I SAM-dependent methyltransferase [Brooklawnia cerclae]|uniref:SAM-dependent methyltransferase n=1 Tax=Brooklawnia cerclae TaxID=349934 RepID=A0ABX0SIG9_9ACTN|nr:class I SAM-dependent methyltransferase [Brooklawnia cerclae]NIH58182.1 SAM-dependent methyltransferase [Brooklawnia cerclae]